MREADALAFLHAHAIQPQRTNISSWSSLNTYLKVQMQDRKTECFRVLFLYPRALELSASALILVHNHPSGDATPSSADVVVGSEGCASFKALGFI